MIEAILQFLFIYNRDGVYVHGVPLLVEQLKSFPDKVKLEYLPNGCIRAWTPEGYNKYIEQPKAKENIKIKLNELKEQMAIALEAGDIPLILSLRKQIREINI